MLPSVARRSPTVLFAVALLVVAAPPAQPTPGGSVVTVGAHTFAVPTFGLIADLPADHMPLDGSTMVALGGTRDADGVYKYRHTDGKLYDHPVGQAQSVANFTRNYRISGDPKWLAIAEANAQRMIDSAFVRNNALFFVYRFDFNNYGRFTLRNPWPSAMGQGIALGGFSRLYEITGAAKWKDAADRTFASFKLPYSTSAPWVTGVDHGRLWFDEYPNNPLDKTFNGHNFAVFGLWHYWRVFNNSEARLMALGGAHTAIASASTVRVPGGISHYCISAQCLTLKIRNPTYHLTHIGQWVNFFKITRHEPFARQAEIFIRDNPWFRDAGTMRFMPGVHIGYTFDAAGNRTKVKSTVGHRSWVANYSSRNVPAGAVKPGNGVHMLVTDGYFAGLWVPESSIVIPRGYVDRLRFYWPRSIDLAAGNYTARNYDAEGNITDSASVSTGAARWQYAEYARINGSPAVRLSDGPLAGRWLTLGPDISRP